MLKAYPLPANAEVHIGWDEAVNEVIWEPQGVHLDKLVVCPKTGTIMPEYYLSSPEQAMKDLLLYCEMMKEGKSGKDWVAAINPV